MLYNKKTNERGGTSPMYKKQDDLGRLSDPSLLILASLASGPKHGYAMMEDIFQFCGTKLEPGTLYAALARLERRGWIEALQAEERRRPYKITGAGEIALRAQIKTLQQVVSTGQQRLSPG
jgi:DNA-binding PadR family transcriptional regulator